MFERRLKVVLALPILCGLVIVARLCQLQVLRGAHYAASADAALTAPKQFLPPLRGRILDRTGRVLVSDEPAHDVAVHYGVLSMSQPYLFRLADRIRKQESRYQNAADSVIEAEVRRRLAEMWITLERASGVSLKEIRRRRDAKCRTVERWRRHRRRALGAEGLQLRSDEVRLKEDDLFHSILRDVTPETRTRIEMAVSGLPCVRVQPSVRRVFGDNGESICHILGRLGEVSAERIQTDPLREDWLACYRAGDEAGVTGVERLAEPMLRGKRGFEEEYHDGNAKARLAPIDGLDVQLTIDMDLQQEVADILAAAVAEHPPSTAAACVVLDVDTREILALVSVPTFDPHVLGEDYASLRDDARRRPLLFRAVSEEYQPGSILKPVAMLAGFKFGLVNPDEPTLCDGQLIPGVNKWHCWTHWRGLPGHGPMAAEEALQHSCNVYFYNLGQRISADGLTQFYKAFILGATEDGAEPRGTGLVEERSGIIPTRDWIATHRKRRFRPADGRNYAIGQGEIQLTPLQAANMFATLACGEYRAPTLVANEMFDRPAHPIDGIPDAAWQLVRRGLYRCVNEPGGTAYAHARLDAIEICGKTGSAQCVPRIVLQRFTFPASERDFEGLSVIASTPEAACEALGLPPGTRPVRRETVERYPTPDPETGKVPTNAWFAAFAPYHRPRVALALVIEYGGSGGRTAAPVGRQVFEALLASPRAYLEK